MKRKMPAVESQTQKCKDLLKKYVKEIEGKLAIYVYSSH